MHRRLVCALAALLVAPLSWAGFAQVSPAQGFTSAGSTVMYRAAANDVIAGGIARVTAGATLDVGGRLVTFPVAARYASNAALFAARGAWPLLIAGLAAPVVIDWIRGQGITVPNGVPSAVPPGVCTVGPCYQYQSRYGSLFTSDWLPSALSACEAAAAYWNGQPGSKTFRNARVAPSGYECAADGFSRTTGEQSSSGETIGTFTNKSVPPDPGTPVPITQADFESRMSGVSLPDNVPPALPVPLPVEQPILNPSADPVPVPQPLVVPQGSPVPVPNTNPQQYRQPLLKITPTPSPAYPWQVNLDPQDVVNEDPNGIKQPQPLPPAGASSAPSSSDLCTLHPEALACQVPNLDVPDEPDLKTEDRGAKVITPDTGWGGSGSCPAARHLSVQGHDIPIPFDLFCQYMSGIRPIVLAMAWLAAAFIFVGGVKES